MFKVANILELIKSNTRWRPDKSPFRIADTPVYNFDMGEIFELVEVNIYGDMRVWHPRTQNFFSYVGNVCSDPSPFWKKISKD